MDDLTTGRSNRKIYTPAHSYERGWGGGACELGSCEGRHTNFGRTNKVTGHGLKWVENAEFFLSNLNLRNSKKYFITFFD